MSAPLKAADLVGLGEPCGAFLVLDPGKTCGVALWGASYDTNRWWTVPLDGLPQTLREHTLLGDARFVVCENFVLRGGAGNNDTSMPASQGIGMARMACYAAGVPLYLVPPICKRAGHMALDEQGRAAYAACRNDHERDVVDIAGFVLREVHR